MLRTALLRSRHFSTEPRKPIGFLDNLIDRIKELALFRNDGYTYLNYPKKNDDKIPSFRTPAPGSQERANVPRAESADDVYNTVRYTRKKPLEPYVVETAEKKYIIQQEYFEGSSPGKNIPEVFRYDPTGTRVAATTTNEAVQRERLKYVPNHLPTPYWQFEEESLEEEAKRKNLSLLIGRETKWARSVAVYEYEQ